MLWGHTAGDPTVSRGVTVSFIHRRSLSLAERGGGLPEQGPGQGGMRRLESSAGARVSPIRLYLESDGDP